MARKQKVMAENKQEDDVIHEEPNHDQNVDSIQMHPSMTKMEAMSQAINLMGIMPKDMVINAFNEMLKQAGYTADNIPDGNAAKNAAGITMKPSFAAADTSPLNLGGTVKEAIEEIFGEDAELSEEFKTKTEALFEAALSARVTLIQEELQEAAEAELVEAVEQLTESFDQYVTHVAEEWMKENEVALENALKLEIMEGFVGDLKDLFQAHYFNVPEEKEDVLEAMGARMAELEDKLNNAIQENIEMKEYIVSGEKDKVIDKVTTGMNELNKQKFKGLVESFEYTDNYEAKLVHARDSVFNKKGTPKLISEVMEEDAGFDNPEDEKKPAKNPAMSQYVQATSQWKEKISR